MAVTVSSRHRQTQSCSHTTRMRNTKRQASKSSLKIPPAPGRIHERRLHPPRRHPPVASSGHRQARLAPTRSIARTTCSLRPGQVLIGMERANRSPPKTPNRSHRRTCFRARNSAHHPRAKHGRALLRQPASPATKRLLSRCPRAAKIVSDDRRRNHSRGETILGAGVTGLAGDVYETSRAHGLRLRCARRREEQIESLGAKIRRSRYGRKRRARAARRMDEAFCKQRELLGNVLRDQNVVITTPWPSPAGKAPVLVTREMVEKMSPGSSSVISRPNVTRRGKRSSTESQFSARSTWRRSPRRMPARCTPPTSSTSPSRW